MNNLINKIVNENCIDGMRQIPDNSIDLIFADPPYWMQTENVLLRTEGTPFKGTDDAWDKFNSYQEYDDFSYSWLKECKRILKKDGSLWVIGAFQNIYRIGYLLQELNMWIINDIIWNKTNPTPNFKGTRFANASETMLWCTKNKTSKYTFNYKTMKHLNGGKQMRSVWEIALCTGNERLKDKLGNKVHNTQKPEKLLRNIILSSSTYGDIVLDPFMGSGTTAAVAKMYGRKYIGFELSSEYIEAAANRLNNIQLSIEVDIMNAIYDIKPKRIPIQDMIKDGYLHAGKLLYDKKEINSALLKKDGKIIIEEKEYSIHKGSAYLLGVTNNNGWDYWYYKSNGSLVSIDDLRKNFITDYETSSL